MAEVSDGDKENVPPEGGLPQPQYNEPKKRKANPVFAARKARAKTLAYTVVKTGFNKFVKDKGMAELLQEAVTKCSRIAVEASMLTSFHVLRLLYEGKAVPNMTDTFFNQFVSAVANMGSSRKSSIDKKNPDLAESVRLYRQLQPENYEPTERMPYMTQMLVMIAQQAEQNFKVSTQLTFTGRLASWIRLRIRLSASEYFTEHENDIIKSAVSLLTRASTEEPYSVAALLPKYQRFREYPVPEEETLWMQSLCDHVRAKIGPLPLRVDKTPHEYLPFLRDMLRDIEEHLENNGESFKGCRAFSLLPQKSIRPLNIKINNTVLRDLAKYKGDPVDMYEDDDDSLWRSYFDTRLVTRGRDGYRSFENFMVTDGMSVSVVVARPKATDAEPAPAPERKRKAVRRKEDSSARKEEAERAFSTATRIIGLDPGRKSLVTAVVHDPLCRATLTEPGNRKNEVVKWSKGRFYGACGYTRRNHLTKSWVSKNVPLKNFNENVPTSKVSSVPDYSTYVRFCLDNLDSVLDFYSAKRFKRLRWKTYLRKQKAYESLVKDLTGGGNKNTVIAYGDAGFASSAKGNAPVPTSGLRKKISSRVRCVDVDEFRTSKLCCACHREMRGLLVEDADGLQTRLYGVRRCTNNECHRTVWDRDVNAAINILNMFLSLAEGGDRPAAFCRTDLVDEVD